MTGPAPTEQRLKPGMLQGLRVVETADELGEYCGLLLCGLGAEIIKIEPEVGSPTRRIGPFLGDEEHPEKSLYFWAYNRGKKSVRIADPEDFLRLVGSADILLDSTGGRCAKDLGIDPGALNELYPALITARLTPFGDTGPWKDFKASDLIHLALGGVMMNCGYDAAPDGTYDLPPIAPQLWHAYHIAGEQLAIGIAAALFHRQRTGEGQDVSCAVHEAVSKNTEVDLMSWVMRRAPLYRQTGRHAVERPNRTPNMSYTKDGRWVMSWGVSAKDKAKLVPFLDRYGMAGDLQPPDSGADLTARNVPGSTDSSEESNHTLDIIQRFVRAYCYRDVPWREAQETGLLWAPIRKPEENAVDEHFLSRTTFTDIEHPEFGRAFRYPTSKWLSTATAWQPGSRAPFIGEHTAAVLAEGSRPAKVFPDCEAGHAPLAPRQAVSAAGHPDLRFLVVPRLGRRHALPRLARRGEPEGRVEGQSRHAPRGDGAGRRTRRTGEGDGAAERRHRCRHGRPVQPQECRQARPLAQRPASEGPQDRQGPDPPVGHRRRGLLPRRARPARPRL